jgi:hypothetical protein
VLGGSTVVGLQSRQIKTVETRNSSVSFMVFICGWMIIQTSRSKRPQMLVLARASVRWRAIIKVPRNWKVARVTEERKTDSGHQGSCCGFVLIRLFGKAQEKALFSYPARKNLFTHPFLLPFLHQQLHSFTFVRHQHHV